MKNKTQKYLPSANYIGDSNPDEYTLRNMFFYLHSNLRDRGLNPIEALTAISDAISGKSDSISLDLATTEFLKRATPADISSAFQTFLSDDLRSAFGQYLTPKPVADHVASLVYATLKNGATVLDPFAGSGILLAALHELRPDIKFVAIEINPSAVSVATAIATSSGIPIEIITGDAFDLWIRDGISKVDAVVMNPPFGSKLVTVPSDEIAIFHDLSGWGPTRTAPVELFALELASSVVREGGLIAAVLPQSVLSNRTFAKFRQSFFQKNELLHVTSLPEATFAPYKGVAKACVCLIRVGSGPKAPHEFSVIHSKSVGYDETGRTAKENDLIKPKSISTGNLNEHGVVSLSSISYVSSNSVRLGDVATIFRGRNPRDADYAETSNAPYLLKVGSLSGSMLSWKARKRCYVDIDFYKKAGEKALKLGDICLTAAAHKPRYIGLKVDLVDLLPDMGAVPSAELLVIRVKDLETLPPEFLLFYLRSSDGYRQIQSMVKGSTAHLYPSDLEDLEIPITLDLAEMSKLKLAFATASQAHHEALASQAKAYIAAGLEPFFSPIQDEE